MGYLQDLRHELEQILRDKLDEETKKTVLNFVSTKVYDSWKNGVERGKAEAQAGQTSSAPNSTSAVSN